MEISELSTQRSSKEVSADDLALVRKYMTQTYEESRAKQTQSLEEFLEEKIETFRDISMPGDWLWENEFKWQWLKRELCPSARPTTDVLSFFSLISCVYFCLTKKEVLHPI